MINYYEEFGLDPNMTSQAICEALFKEKKVWSKRQNAADLEKRQEAERKVPLIDEAMAVFSDEERRKAFDEEIRKSAEAQRQAQQAQQRAQQQAQTQYQYNNRQSQPDPNRSAYGTPNRTPSVSFKENAKLTGIVSYLTWIGWLIAFFAGDREGAKVHLNSTAVLFLLFIICDLAENLGKVFSTVFGIAEIGLVILWIIGFIYALIGENKELPIIGGIHVIK